MEAQEANPLPASAAKRSESAAGRRWGPGPYFCQHSVEVEEEDRHFAAVGVGAGPRSSILHESESTLVMISHCGEPPYTDR